MCDCTSGRFVKNHRKIGQTKVPSNIKAALIVEVTSDEARLGMSVLHGFLLYRIVVLCYGILKSRPVRRGCGLSLAQMIEKFKVWLDVSLLWRDGHERASRSFFLRGPT